MTNRDKSDSVNNKDAATTTKSSNNKDFLKAKSHENVSGSFKKTAGVSTGSTSTNIKAKSD
eukprot:CAMPEP_0114592234 /NCGR_PEP_ID=MMETSP0125-20121206/14107_1 /TAXON_ID=485358 ORGANISM="Aristerostoma sp., Strain ATCC 50986" /NCGR_SAMPLE_ID=MMETSP0125 /ASSEMBLY_ACC=CAM_ASM_000245 /LENGTH=60 /DNA_ID=CAMNT_0001790767 /DNA_START=35 /DNA_END=217 /DNA_ORIENTATION=-